MAEHNEEQVVTPPAHDEPIGWAIVLLGALTAFILLALVVIHSTKSTSSFDLWVHLLGVGAILAMFTVLYKENRFFRFVEHIYIGLATGYSIAYTWVIWAEPKWVVPMLPRTLVHGGQGHWMLISGLLIGSLFFTVYFPKYTWMNRFAVIVLMGSVSGMALEMFMGSLAPQIVAAFRPPVSTYTLGSTSVNNFHGLGVWWHPWALLSFLIMLCAMAYFFFSIEHKTRLIKAPSVIGRYFLMITLGAVFGTTVMGRLALVIERIGFVADTVKEAVPFMKHLFFH